MSDSGFSNLPSGVSRGADKLPSQRDSGLSARIVEVSGELRELRQATKIAGKVTQITKDNTIEVQTERGNIKIRVPNDRRSPKKGDDVDVELQAGKPPRKARVARQDTSDKTKQVEATPAENTQNNKATRQTANTREADPRTQSTQSRQPAEYQAAQRTEQTAPPPPPLHEKSVPVDSPERATRASPLLPDAVVRLTPLSPTQFDNITNGIKQTLNAKLQVLNHGINLLQLNQTEQITEALKSSNIFRADAPPLKQIQTVNLPVVSQLQQISAQPLQQSSAPQTAQAQTVTTQTVAAQTQSTSPLANLLQIIADRSPSQPLQQTIQQQPNIALAPLDISSKAPSGFDTATKLGTVQHLNQAEPVSILKPIYFRIDAIAEKLTVQASAITNAIQSGLQSAAIGITGAAPELHTQALPPRPDNPFVDAKITSISQPSVKLVAAGEAANAVQGSKFSVSQSLEEIQLSTPLKTDANSATSLRAEVIGFTGERSLPVISFFTADGLLSQPFSMQFLASNLSQGSHIDLVPQMSQHTAPPQAVAMQAAAAAPLFASLSQLQWPALDELNAALQQPNMQSAVQTSMQHLPSPSSPARLPAAALLFVAAVHSGDLGAFLNDKTTDLLRRMGKSDLIKKIGGDMKSISRMSSEPVSQDWRAMPLPMTYEGELKHVMMYYKKDQQDDSDTEGDKNAGTRFLFNLSLNKMGPVQLDGYHRKERLDLIVRMETKPTSHMQQAMRRVYINALEQAGTVGELSFQSKSDKWVTIQADQENTFYHA